MSRQPPAQQPPPVQKLWLRYAKRGRGRFASHRDFARAFERALRRAGTPMAYSSGFNPHPRISWANPAPTGAESESEYVAIGLATVVDPAELAVALDAALPPGFALLAAGPAGANLMAELTHSVWEIAFPVWEIAPPARAGELSVSGAADWESLPALSGRGEPRDRAADPETVAETDRLAPNTTRTDPTNPNTTRTDPTNPNTTRTEPTNPNTTRTDPTNPNTAWADRLARDVAWFLAQPAVAVSRQTKDGRRQFDARGPVVSLTLAEPSPDSPQARPGLRLVTRHTVPLVRPDDVVQALAGADPGLGGDCLMRRTAQGRLLQGRVVDPLPEPPPA